MWALTVFADQIWYVCHLKNVVFLRQKFSVKYKDNKKYAARVIAICHDERVLAELKSNLEGDIRNIQDSWKLERLQVIDYAKASREIIENQEGNILFVDKNILSRSKINTLHRSFALSKDINLSKFVLELPQFQRLRKDFLKTDENAVVHPSSVSMNVDMRSKLVPRAIHQDKLLKKAWVSLHNIDITAVTSKSSEKVESPEILVNETDSCEESLTNNINPNMIIDETPPDSSIQNDSSDLSNLLSPGKPIFSSTIQEVSISPTIITTNVIEMNQEILEETNYVESTIIDSSSVLDDIPLMPSEKHEKSDFSHLAPISKPNYCAENRTKGGELFGAKSEQIAPCTNQKKTVIPKLFNEVIQTEGGLGVECKDFNGDERGNFGKSSQKDESNQFSQQGQEERGESQCNSCVNETSIIPGTPPGDLGLENNELNFQHDHVNATFTFNTSSIPNDVQSNSSEPSLINSKVSQIDGDLLRRNSSEPETVTPPSSEVFGIFPETRPIDVLNLSDHVSPGSVLVKNDIDQFKDNIPLMEENTPNQNNENMTEKTMKNMKTEEEVSGKKRKAHPTIISDEKVNLPLFKRQKIDDSVQCDSPSIQNGKSETSRYNTRKKFTSVVKCTYPQGSRSELSEPEETTSGDEKKIIKPQTGVKRRVVFEFNESDDGGESDEYVPSDDETSGSDGDNDLSTDGEELEEDLAIEKRFSDSLNITTGDCQQTSAPDDSELAVDPISSSTKKHFCFFCKKLQAKLARHLQLVHSKEEEVKKFIALPPKNKERQEIIAAIRKNGDHIYNTNRQFNNGTLIVCRRSLAQRGKTAKDFIACGNCKGQYSRTVIRHHWRRCTKRHGKNERIVLVKGKKVSGRVHERANNDVRKHIFPYLREDEIVRSIRYDELLILFANKQCEKYGTNPHLYQMIRARLRLLGRFLVAIKKINNRITTCMDVFQARNYDSMIEAVRKVAVFIPESKTFQHPAVGSSLGTLLKQVGEVLRSEFIKRESMDQKKQVEDFLSLLAEDYGTSINRVVTETQTQNHRRKEVQLPSTEDIKKLYGYIITERSKYLSEVNERFSFHAWKKLGETTLLSLQIFNRRRPGELERLYIEDYRSYRGIDDMADREIYETLSAEGKALAKRYVRFEIRGKRNRSVPVLIDSDVVECLEMILNYRNEAGVPERNLYLFGLPSSDKDRHKYLRACDLMREYSAKCGAEIPHLLRGTELRKHIATRCILLNLEGSQVTDLANFMGHHENIHKQIYRQPVAATDIVKISKILNIVQDVEGADDDSDDGKTTQSTRERYNSNNPNVSRDDSTYGLDTTGTSYRSQNSQSFVQSECSTSKRQWSTEQRTAVLSAFGEQLENGNIPSGKKMQELIDHENCLRSRTVAQMRTWLHTYKKKLTQ